MKPADNIVRFPDAEQLEERAAEWAVRIAEGELSADERIAFHSWYSASARHREALARLSHVWQHCDALAELSDHAAADVTRASRAADRSRTAVMLGYFPNRRSLLAAGVAAVALLIAGKLAQKAVVTTPPVAGEMYATTAETAIGERATVALPDGSWMELNTHSAVAVRYTANERIVRLTRGEAHFIVASNAHRPFSVHAGDRVVTAVGTAFTVQLKADAIEVTVAEGKISLGAAHANPRKRVPDLLDRAVPALEAGQRAVLQDGREAVATLPPAELERRLAWRQGMLAFAGEPLSHVLEELERYTDVVIEVTDPTLRALPVAGRLRIDDVASMLEALQLMAEVRVERLDDRHVRLLPKGSV
jgi:transmembrane sensor